MTVRLTAPVANDAMSTPTLNNDADQGQQSAQNQVADARCHRGALLPQGRRRGDSVEHDRDQAEAARGIGERRGNAGGGERKRQQQQVDAAHRQGRRPGTGAAGADQLKETPASPDRATSRVPPAPPIRPRTATRRGCRSAPPAPSGSPTVCAAAGRSPRTARCPRAPAAHPAKARFGTRTWRPNRSAPASSRSPTPPCPDYWRGRSFPR